MGEAVDSVQVVSQQQLVNGAFSARSYVRAGNIGVLVLGGRSDRDGPRGYEKKTLVLVL